MACARKEVSAIIMFVIDLKSNL